MGKTGAGERGQRREQAAVVCVSRVHDDKSARLFQAVGVRVADHGAVRDRRMLAQESQARPPERPEPRVRSSRATADLLGKAREELLELVMHTVFYAGLPAAHNAFGVAKKVLAEAGL